MKRIAYALALLSAAPAAGAQDLTSALVDPERILVVDFEGGGRALIELAPEFAPGHVERMKELSRTHYYDGKTIWNHLQNYSLRFGWANDDPRPEAETDDGAASQGAEPQPRPEKPDPIPGEFERPMEGLDIVRVEADDPFAPTGLVDGFPVAYDEGEGLAWLAHCPGAVGLFRRGGEDTADQEVYVVTGQAPRTLDRVFTLFGFVRTGLNHFAGAPTGPYYQNGHIWNREERKMIASIRVAADIPEEERPILRRHIMEPRDVVENLLERSKKPDHPLYRVQPAEFLDVCTINLYAEEAYPGTEVGDFYLENTTIKNHPSK